jgi:non-ribosomal peptide synthetase component F
MLWALDPSEEYSTIRAIFLGGEKPPERLVQQWISPSRVLYNCYGPTETTCASLIGKLIPGEPVTLGDAMANSRVLLVNESMREADEGEIYISGPGLAAGYFNNDELTREKFILWGPTQERFYRTGDIAKRTSQGLEFLGRNDSLAKHRGFLINIEADVKPALLSCSGVEDALALLQRGNLIGFVTPGSLSGHDIREQLVNKVDAFIVPERIYALDRLPITVNGKVDQVALSTLVDAETTRVNGQGPSSPASYTPLDVLIRTISEALGIQLSEENMSSSFWDLGGNSLTAIRVINDLRRHSFRIPSVKALYQEPLEKLLQSYAPFTDTVKQLKNPQSRPPSDLNNGSASSFPITTMQQKMLRATINNPTLNHILISIRIQHENHPLNLNKLHEAFSCVFQRHTIFRTVFNLQDQSQSIQGNVTLDYRQDVCRAERLQETLSQRESMLFSQLHTGHHYNEASFRAVNALRVIAVPHQATHILWMIHHSLLDGWSTQVILDELKAFMNGEQLPPCAPSFAPAARKQQDLALQADDAQIDFWRRSMDSYLPPKSLQLPTHRSDDGLLDLWPEEFLSMESGRSRLQTAASRANVSTASFLYGAWAMLLSRYLSTSRVVFGAVLSGRDIDYDSADKIVGPFINTCPFPIEIDRTANTISFLRVVQKTLFNIQDFQWSASKFLTEHLSASWQSELFTSLVAVQVGLHDQNANGNPGYLQWTWTQKAKSEFPLTLVVEDDDDHSLKVRIVFDNQRLAKGHVKRLIRHYLNILDKSLDDTEGTVGEILDQMMDPEEFHRLTKPHDGFYNTFEGAAYLTTAFSNAAREWPSSRALQCDQRYLTYSELHDVSNRAAAGLREFLGEGYSVVAVMSDGSIEWIVCILTVLKSGAAYCPIDVKLPVERMKTMLSESRSSVILCPNTKSQQICGENFSQPVLLLEDMDWESNEAMSPVLPTESSGNHTACIIFTSGSTGVPKGG